MVIAQEVEGTVHGQPGDLPVQPVTVFGSLTRRRRQGDHHVAQEQHTRLISGTGFLFAHWEG